MIIIETELADSRRVRVFYKALPSRAEDVRTTAEQSFFDDDDDRERERRIVSLLTGPNIQTVRAVAYPTLGARDVLQLYVRDGDDDLFACVLMTHARLRETLREPPFVEGFSHQVIQGDHLSVEGVRTAVRIWVERCFPRATANLVVELWTGPDGISYEVLALILSSKTVSVTSPAFEDGVEPDPNIVQPQYETSAA